VTRDVVAHRRIDYRTTSVRDAVRIMVDRHGLRAMEVARNREDAASTEAGAAFWQRVVNELAAVVTMPPSFDGRVRRPDSIRHVDLTKRTR